MEYPRFEKALTRRVVYGAESFMVET